MSYDDLLINVCDILKYTQGVQDGYGTPAKAVDVANSLYDEPCRWSTPANREIKIGAEVVLADLQLFLGDISVTEQDTVELDSVAYEILSVVNRQDAFGNHHIECLLRTVK